MTLSDAALVLACRRGDAAAWEALVTRYQRLVYSVPRRAGLSDDLAADVFQHVFTTLVEQLDRIEQPERISAWLVTTARREAWRVGRRHSMARLVAHEAGDEDVLAEIPDERALPDEILVQLEEQHAVRLALRELDLPCQKLLALLYYQSTPPPYTEIAAALGIAVGSIGPTRARCLQKLRRRLERSGD